MRTTFHRLPVGARFEFRGRRFEKVALSIASDEERVGNVFHADTEVVPMESGKWRVESPGGGLAQLPDESGVPVDGVALAGGGIKMRPGWRPRLGFERSRLGRSPGRELRPYGTL
jgi:hypothetical protein